jgi:hypothetical protein
MMPHLPTLSISILFRPQPLVVPFDWFELVVIRQGRGRQGDRGDGIGIGLGGGSGGADGLTNMRRDSAPESRRNRLSVRVSARIRLTRTPRIADFDPPNAFFYSTLQHLTPIQNFLAHT